MKVRPAIPLVVLGLIVLAIALAVICRIGGPAAGPAEKSPPEGSGHLERHSAETAHQGPKADDYSPIWETMVSAPTTEPPKPAKKKPEVKFRLKGLLLQKTERLAVIRDSTGRQRLVREGESIEDAKVTRITQNGITIEIGGETMTLTLDTKRNAP